MSIPSEVAKIKNVCVYTKEFKCFKFLDLCSLHPVSDLEDLANRNSKRRNFKKKIRENENKQGFDIHASRI